MLYQDYICPKLNYGVYGEWKNPAKCPSYILQPPTVSFSSEICLVDLTIGFYLSADIFPWCCPTGCIAQAKGRWESRIRVEADAMDWTHPWPSFGQPLLPQPISPLCTELGFAMHRECASSLVWLPSCAGGPTLVAVWNRPFLASVVMWTNIANNIAELWHWLISPPGGVKFA